MNKVAERKFPYLTNYIETAISQNRLFHSIILYGSNVYMQYVLALETARKLNCLEDGNEECQCQNCRWIRENKHPAVMTVSKIDNKTDSSKTVISEEQVNRVLDTLVNSSDYKRVFIFCDAEVKTLSDVEKKKYDEFLSSGFKPAQENGDDKIWYPQGINMKCISLEAANSMLKSIEEPPSDVTFIFLTENKDDLLQTIVSRSQAFYAGDAKYITYKTDFLDKYLNNYPLFNKYSVLDFAQALYDYQSSNDLSPEFILDTLQYYLTEILKNNSKNDILRNKIFKDIKQIGKSKSMLKSYVKEQTVYENLAFYFAGEE